MRAAVPKTAINEHRNVAKKDEIRADSTHTIVQTIAKVLAGQFAAQHDLRRRVFRFDTSHLL